MPVQLVTSAAANGISFGSLTEVRLLLSRSLLQPLQPRLNTSNSAPQAHAHLHDAALPLQQPQLQLGVLIPNTHNKKKTA